MTTHLDQFLHRGHLPSAGAVAVRLVAAASALMSATYYYGWLPRLPVSILGVELYAAGLAFGCGLAALDLCKGVAVNAAAQLWHERRRLQAALPALVAGVLVVVSFFAVDGLLMQLRVGAAGRATDAQKAWDRSETDYRKAMEELDTLTGDRTIADVRAAMDAAPVPRGVFARTKECTDVTRDDSFASCKPILDLRQEMARAIRKQELEHDVASLKAQLDARERPPAADAQAEAIAHAIAWWRGAEQQPNDVTPLVMLVMCWLIGLGIEGVSTFGPYWSATRPRPAAYNSFSPCGTATDRPASINADLRTIHRTVRRTGKREALGDLLTRLALGQEVPPQDQLAREWGRSKSSVSEWMAEWEREGLIPERRQVGRRKLIQR